MKRKLLIIFLVIATVVLFLWLSDVVVATLTYRTTLEFIELPTADTMLVKTNADTVSRTIVDQSTLDAATAFLARRTSGWGVPWYGPPIAPLQVEFYSQGRLVNRFGIGEDYITTDYAGGFYSQPISQRDRAVIVDIISASDSQTSSSGIHVDSSAAASYENECRGYGGVPHHSPIFHSSGRGARLMECSE